jgi:hypothetical protein
MATDPFLKASVRDAEITFMLGNEDAETVEDVDVEVRLGDGSRWSATCVSLAQVGRIMDRWATTGECLSGSFFQCADLVIIRRPGVPAILEMIEGLLDSGEFRYTFVNLGTDE